MTLVEDRKTGKLYSPKQLKRLNEERELRGRPPGAATALRWAEEDAKIKQDLQLSLNSRNPDMPFGMNRHPLTSARLAQEGAAAERQEERRMDKLVEKIFKRMGRR